jgi:hypothetical protein
MMDFHPSSRRSRHPRHTGNSAPHNSEEAEFSANQQLSLVGAVRTIPVNPRLQMHSTSFFLFKNHQSS